MMKPAHDYAGHITFDLTECKVHRLENPDGTFRIVALYPKTWEAGPKLPIGTAKGENMEVRRFAVSEWAEVVLVASVPA